LTQAVVGVLEVAGFISLHQTLPPIPGCQLVRGDEPDSAGREDQGNAYGRHFPLSRHIHTSERTGRGSVANATGIKHTRKPGPTDQATPAASRDLLSSRSHKRPRL